MIIGPNNAKCQQNNSHSSESCPNAIHVPVNAFTTGSLIQLFSNSKRSLPSLALFRRQQEIQEPYYYTQVISDVDDTLKSSGGVTLFNVPLGGIDTQYKRNEIYPGVAEFMFQLSSFGLHYRSSNNIHPSLTKSRSNTTIAKVAILTARAYELKVFLEMKPNHPLSVLFRTVGEQHHPLLLQQRNSFDWGFGPILYGSVMEWILQDRKGLRKFHNFEQLLSLQHTKPDMSAQKDSTTKATRNTATKTKDLPTLLYYIYVGDTGEYDEEAAMAMLQYYPQYIRAVFLHVVSDHADSSGQQRDVIVPPTKYRNGRPIFYFRTYIGAALLAVQHGYMHRDGLQSIINVVTTTIQQREQQKQDSNRPPFTSDQLYDLERDMMRAKDWLRETL